MTSLGVHPRTLTAAGVAMDQVGDRIRALHGVLDNAHLAFSALSVLGEPARWVYEVELSKELENLDRGVAAAKGIADSLHKNVVTYTDVEDANLRDVLRAMSEGEREGVPARPSDGTKFSFNPGQATAFVHGFEGLFGAFTAEAFSYMALDITAAGLSEAAAVSRVARLSQATLTLMEITGRISVTAGIGVTLWGVAVVGGDEPIDAAISAWETVAANARQIFGDAVPAARAALRKAWSGDAATAADGRIRDFVTAGVELADRADQRAKELRRIVGELNVIHTGAFYICAAELAVLLVYAAASFIPAAEAIKEFIGSTLTFKLETIIAAIGAVLGSLSLVPAAIDFSDSPGLPARTFSA